MPAREMIARVKEAYPSTLPDSAILAQLQEAEARLCACTCGYGAETVYAAALASPQACGDFRCQARCSGTRGGPGSRACSRDCPGSRARLRPRAGSSPDARANFVGRCR